MENSFLLSSDGDLVFQDGDWRDVDFDAGKLVSKLVSVLSTSEDGMVDFWHSQDHVVLWKKSDSLVHMLDQANNKISIDTHQLYKSTSDVRRTKVIKILFHHNFWLRKQ